MNRKKIFTIAGIITTLIALSSAAIACHFNAKKNTDKNNRQNQAQNPDESTQAKGNVRIINEIMYGIPSSYTEEDKKKQDNEDIIMEKYGIPNDVPLLKYAAPPLPSDNTIKELPIVPMYALPAPEPTNNNGDTEQTTPAEKSQNPWK